MPSKSTMCQPCGGIPKFRKQNTLWPFGNPRNQKGNGSKANNEARYLIIGEAMTAQVW